MRELIYNTGIVEEMMFDGTIIKLIKLKFPAWVVFYSRFTIEQYNVLIFYHY